MRPKSVRLARVATRPEDFPRDLRPEIAMLGRSNVGKSSLINRLLNRPGLARVSKSPGRTREIHFYLLDERIYLVDLPGFGYAKVPEAMRRRWANLMAGYFAGRDTLALAVHLVDIRHDPTPLDRMMRDMLVDAGQPFAVALTKADKVSGSRAAQAKARVRRDLGLPEGTPVVVTSAREGKGMRDLARVIEEALAAHAGPGRR